MVQGLAIYDAFLSYNAQDEPAVRDLAEQLQREKITVYLEQWDLRPGDEFQPALAVALQQSKCCVVFLGPSGLGPWQTKEIQIAVDKSARNAAFRVILVLLPGTERPRRGDVAHLDFVLNGSWVEFLKTLDDERQFQRLVWGITGKRPVLPAPGQFAGICPYCGLEAFDSAQFFFGRENLTGWLVSSLRREVRARQGVRFLGVLGPSGSGKSSLVLAGLVPSLAEGAIEGSEHWPIIKIRPGSDPLRSLATGIVARLLPYDPVSQLAQVQQLQHKLRQDQQALDVFSRLALENKPKDTRAVVVVDQFEEVFTHCPQEDEPRKRYVEDRAIFLANLLDAAVATSGRVLVVITMRIDFLSACTGCPEFHRMVDVLDDHQEIVRPLSDDGLRRAIEQPAFTVGCEVEPALTERLLADMKGQMGALPLLQFALTEIWNKREGRRLTLQTYFDLGKDDRGEPRGVEGVLEHRAEQIYRDLKPADQERCRRIFLRLTKLGEGTEDTKRRVPVAELAPVGGSVTIIEPLIRTLADQGLVTTSGEKEPAIEVAHEALIRGWSRLRKWLDESREALRMHDQLHDAALLWDKNQRADDYLYRGLPLRAADKCSREHADLMAQTDQAFLDACVSQLVQELATLETQHIGEIIGELADVRDRAQPFLRGLLAESPPDSNGRLHASLALLAGDPTQVDFLRERLLVGELLQFAVITEYLSPHRDGLREWLWSELEDEHRPPQRRFRSAMALATCFDGQRCERYAPFIAGYLIDVLVANPTHFASLMPALRSIRQVLLAPLTAMYMSEVDPAKQSWVANVLADYAADDPAKLLELACDGGARAFAVFFPRLQLHGEVVTRLAEKEIARQVSSAADRGAQELLAKRQANAAVTLLRLQHTDPVWPILRHSSNPRRRTYLVHRLGPFGVDRQQILQRLAEEPDVSALRALILSLGGAWRAEEPSPGSAPLVDQLLALFRDHADPGIHSAAEWILRSWHHEAKLAEVVRFQTTGRPDGNRRWYVSREGDTFVCLPGPIEFLMGSDPAEPDHTATERLHTERIDHSFAIASKLVSVAQFNQFQQENPEIERFDVAEYAPEPGCPQVTVSWYDGAAYCNWLNQREGLPVDEWCYLPAHDGRYRPGMQTAPDHLRRRGYRFPTEAEWEYACRAQSLTARFYGETAELLNQYAWYQKNADDRTHPVGLLKPNDFGLFDMLGNAWEWCDDEHHESMSRRLTPAAEQGSAREISNHIDRVLRGGSFNNNARKLRSAYRGCDSTPATHYDLIGFRAARTLE